MKTPWTPGLVIRLVIGIPFIIVLCFAEAFANMFSEDWGQAVEVWTLFPLQRLIVWERPFFTHEPHPNRMPRETA